MDKFEISDIDFCDYDPKDPESVSEARLMLSEYNVTFDDQVYAGPSGWPTVKLVGTLEDLRNYFLNDYTGGDELETEEYLSRAKRLE